MNLFFYNIENFFAPGFAGRTVLPQHKSWSAARYRAKLGQTQELFTKIMDTAPPAIFALAEIQGKAVVEDILNLPPLHGKFKAIAAPTGDHRGFQPVLFFQQNLMKLEDFSFPKVKAEETGRYRFRDFIQAKFSMNGHFFQIILLHLPSKRNRDRHQHLREEGLNLVKEILDNSDPEVEKTYILGDFNEDFLCTKTRAKFAGLFQLAPEFNFAEKPTAFHQGRGVVCDHIFCFSHKSQMMENLENHRMIFPELLMTGRTTLAKPRPMYVGTRYFGGLSDHFPITAKAEFSP